MSQSYVVPPFAAPPPGGARRRRPAVLLVALLGALSLMSVMVQGTAARADIGPVSSVSFPSGGTQVGTGTQVTVRGGANNGEGGILRVELSLDGGQTWHLTQPSLSAEDWSYTFTPTDPAVLSLVSRAVTANAVETPTWSVTLKVSDSTGAMRCPCMLNWPTPEFGVHGEDDAAPVELGLRFMSTRDGSVAGLMFRRDAGNNGPHVAHLWDAYGNLLAEQTLTDIRGRGPYPYLQFDQPVPIQAGHVYTVSYYTPTGHYASSEYYFSNSYWDYDPPFSTPLNWVPVSEAPEDYAGVYHYGEGGGFPNETWHASNYWVEPVFTTS